MTDSLPRDPDWKLIQSPGPATKTAAGRLEHVVAVVPVTAGAQIWKSLPDGARLRALARRAPAGRPVCGQFPGTASTGLTLGRLKLTKNGELPAAFDLLKFCGGLVKTALQGEPRTLGLLVTGLPEALAETVTKSLVLAIGARTARMPDFRSKKRSRRSLRSVRIIGLGKRLDMSRVLTEIEAANVVRHLTAMPPNKLDAGGYRRIVASMAKDNGWQMKHLGDTELRRKKAGAFLAVAQGNENRDAGIIHLRYRPAKAQRPILALVGKGVVFDTGGTNLKPFRSMLDMHEDMAGSAVALATLLALTRLEFAYPVDCWLAITENRPGPAAYKSRDVVTASNGVTIEVIHTDAEGRMALADTLALASHEKPGMIIDYATLTGSCVSALSERYSGVFTNRPGLHSVLADAGRESGERVWPFPADEDFDEDLKSNVADVLQCSAEGSADHILAARFLQRFVSPECAWVHMDLSSASRKAGLAQVPGGPTGFGVRYTLNLLTEQAPRLEELIGDQVRNA